MTRSESFFVYSTEGLDLAQNSGSRSRLLQVFLNYCDCDVVNRPVSDVILLHVNHDA